MTRASVAKEEWARSKQRCERFGYVSRPVGPLQMLRKIVKCSRRHKTFARCFAENTRAPHNKWTGASSHGRRGRCQSLASRPPRSAPGAPLDLHKYSGSEKTNATHWNSPLCLRRATCSSEPKHSEHSRIGAGPECNSFPGTRVCITTDHQHVWLWLPFGLPILNLP